MLPGYDPCDFDFFREAPVRPAGPAGAPPRSPRGEAWTPALFAALWLNRNLSLETCRALIGLLGEGELMEVGAGERFSLEEKAAIIVSGRVKMVMGCAIGHTHLRDGQWIGLEKALVGTLSGDFEGPQGASRLEAIESAEVLAIPVASLVGLMKAREDLEVFVAVQVFHLLGEDPAWRGLLRRYDGGAARGEGGLGRVKLHHELERPERWVERLAQTSFLELLNPEDRALLLQSSSLYRETGVGGDVYLPAGRASDKVGLILRGEALSFLPDGQGEAPTMVARASGGDLLGYGNLASASERTPTPSLRPDSDPMAAMRLVPEPRRTDIHLKKDTVVLEFPWAVLRWLLFEKKVIWRRVCADLSVGVLTTARGQGEVFVFHSDAASSGKRTLARGAAMALTILEEGVAAEPICLIDLKSSEETIRVFGADPDRDKRFCHADLEDGAEDDFDYWIVDVSVGQGAPLRIIGCDDLTRTGSLVRYFREQGEARYILVATDSDSTGRDVLEHFIELGCAMVWIIEDAHAVFDYPRPRHLIRAELLNDAFIERELARVGKVMGDLSYPGATTMPESLGWARHVLRVPFDKAGAAHFKASTPEAFFRDEPLGERSPLRRAFERLARMMRGRTVGLALGGGGSWGFTHIALIKALEAREVPIDYISGTSFGALVAGLYAAGGTGALERLLRWSDKDPGAPEGGAGGGFCRALCRAWTDLNASRLSRRVSSAVFNSHHLQTLVDDILQEHFEPERRVQGEARPFEALMIWLAQSVLTDDMLHFVVYRDGGEPRMLARNLLKGRQWDPVGNKHFEQEAMRTTLSYSKRRHFLIGTTPIPFIPLGADVIQDTSMPLVSGTVGLGVRLASCLPPVYPALWSSEARLIDGALIEFVPAQATRQKGADFVIASNVIPTNSKLLEKLQKHLIEGVTRQFGGINGLIEPFKPALGSLQRLGLLPTFSRLDNAASWDKQIENRYRRSFTLRLVDSIKGFYLMSWKAGQDKGAKHANYIVDMQPTDFDMMEFWRGREIVARYTALIEDEGLAESIYNLWCNPDDWDENDAFNVRLSDRA